VKALRERVVLHHPPHLQGFDPTTAVSRCIVLRRLAMEVASLATDRAVLTRPLALGLAPALTALLAAAHPPLRLPQPFLSVAVVARVLYPLAVRIGQGARQPHIPAQSRMRACPPLRMDQDGQCPARPGAPSHSRSAPTRGSPHARPDAP